MQSIKKEPNFTVLENEFLMDCKKTKCNKNKENNEYCSQKTQDIEDIRKSHKKCGEIYMTGIENFKFVCMLCEKTFFTCIEEFLSHVVNCQQKDEICTIEIDPLEFQQNCDYSPVEQKSLNVIPKEEVENSSDSNAEIESTLDPTEMLSLVDQTEKLREKHCKSSSDIFCCNYCDKVYILKRSFERHMKAAHQLDIEVSSVYVYCNVPDCNKKFEKKEFLDAHKRFEHKQDPDELTVDSQVKTDEDNSEETKEQFDRYTCKYCEQRFTAPYKRAEHERIHAGEKPFKCSTCGKGFHLPRARNLHELIHQGIKPYKCEICNSEFTQKSSLDDHNRRTHSGEEKKIKCGFCEKTFYSNSEKKIHERTHTGEKSYLCFECGHRFRTAHHLNRHIQRHTGIKPFKCDQCEKTFFSKKYLKTHYFLHTGEKPFTCHICGSKFSARESMKSHLKIHSDIAQYTCTICGKSFKQRPGLYTHMKSHGKVLTKS